MRMLKILTVLVITSLPVQLLRAQEVYTDNVVIVLDASGSMGERMSDGKGGWVVKMQAAKSALHEVIKQVPDNVNIGLLVFSAKNLRDHWVYPLGPKDDAKLKSAIDLPIPGGGTPLGAYIKIGADRLLQERARQHGYGSYRQLIVTDGEAGDKQLVEKYTPEVISRGIVIDVIGVNMATQHTLATKVNSYRSANDPQSLTKAIREILAEASTSGDSDSGMDVFEEIQDVPAESAGTILTNLAVTGNHFIGDVPKVSKAAQAPVQPASKVQPSVRQPVSGQGAAQPTKNRINVVSQGIITLAVICFVFILVKLAGKRGR